MIVRNEYEQTVDTTLKFFSRVMDPTTLEFLEYREVVLARTEHFSFVIIKKDAKNVIDSVDEKYVFCQIASLISDISRLAAKRDADADAILPPGQLGKLLWINPFRYNNLILHCLIGIFYLI